jgi:hypothetical protein
MDIQKIVELSLKATPEQVGEFVQELEFEISKVQMEVIKSEKALNESPQAVALRAHKDEVAKYEAALDALKGVMLDQIQSAGLAEVITATGYKFSVRTSPGALEIVDEAKLKEMRSDLFVEKTTVVPDKKAIKAAIESGNIPTDWAVIKKSQSLSVTKPA